MQRTPVSSSQISSVGYDKDTQTLEVEFSRGGVYQYFSVPEIEYRAILSAASAGRYFHSRIRNIYDFKRMETA